MPLRSAYVAPDEFTALTIRDLLVEHGVPALIRSNELLGFGGLTHLARNWGEVLVEERHLSRAIELIAGFRGTLGMLTELEPGAGGTGDVDSDDDGDDAAGGPAADQ
jgi:hypothetical protein